MHYFKPYIAWDSLSNFGWSIDATRYLNRPASIQDSVQSNLRSNQINCHGKKQESLTVSFREKETKNVLLSPSFSFFIAFCSFIFLKNSFRILPKSSKHTDSKFKAFLTWKKKIIFSTHAAAILLVSVLNWVWSVVMILGADQRDRGRGLWLGEFDNRSYRPVMG